MKGYISNKESNILLNALFAVPICTYVIAVLTCLLIYYGNNIILLKTLAGLSTLLTMVCIGFFVVCLVNLKNKEVPLHKKLICAGLNIGVLFFVSYAVFSHM